MTPLDRLAGRRILFVNWRDHTHPQAGGAEVYCEEIARSFAAAGADVTLFTSRHGDAPVAEVQRGVRYVRSGRTFDVYARAAAYMRERRDSLDAVVDLQNGIPFFAPLFAGTRVATVCVIHHVHQRQFDLHFPKPVAAVGRFLEGPAARLVYGVRPVVAVSPSTRESVRRALRLRGPIHIVPNGVLPIDPADRDRSSEPRIALVTRLVPQKRIELLVRAAAALRDSVPDLHVDIAGSGPSEATLRALVEELGLQDRVHVHGWVSNQERDALWRRAWLTVVPSVREGWGLTVLEANQWGVPSVAFDVPGLRDAVLDGGTTGWLVGQDSSLDETITYAVQQLADEKRAAAMAERCRAWSARFSWQESARRLAAVIDAEIDRVTGPERGRRAPGDQATVAHFTVVDDEAADTVERRLGRRLRRTDDLIRQARSFTLLLQGSDELEAAALLRDVTAGGQLVGLPRFQVAESSDLLTGVREASA